MGDKVTNTFNERLCTICSTLCGLGDLWNPTVAYKLNTVIQYGQLSENTQLC